MGEVAGRDVLKTTVFQESGGYSLYVVEFSPAGYVVLNSDDRLPLVVSFSPTSTIDLSDDPQNTFRVMLIQYAARMEEKLLTLPENSVLETSAKPVTTVTVQYGPYLETTWNQCNPYNLLCPDDPDGTSYYGYRAASGCTPTAYAQLMNFHRWPLRGTSSFSYTDSAGSIVGTHSAVYSDTYAWNEMLSSYSAYSENPAASVDAVSELMFELGVAAEADYESSGTSSSIATLGRRLGEFFYYEPCVYQSTTSDLISPMEEDLSAGFPCVVAIPGHAVVADGLLIEDGSTTYHINYGWGGTNNGWFTVDGIPGGGLQYGVTSLRPRLIALPVNSSVSFAESEPVELEWMVPLRRTNEIGRLEIQQIQQQSGSWSSDCSQITGDNNGWEVVDAGYTGDCWFTGPNNYASLVLGEVFVPNSSTVLSFRQCAQIYISQFSVEVSTDDGETYEQIYITASDTYNWNWIQKSLSLADYAGQEIRIRFVLSASGGYYDSTWAGVRLDDIAITTESWSGWSSFAIDNDLLVRDPAEITDPLLDGQPVYYSVLSNLSVGTYTLVAQLVDTNGVEQGISSSVTVTVTEDTGVGTGTDDGDGMPEAWELLYGLDPDSDDGALDPDNDGYSNYAEYICGTVPTNAESVWKLESGAGTMPSFMAIADRLYTIKYCTNLVDDTWFVLVSDLPGSNGSVEVETYDTAATDTRFYRVEVREQN